MTPRDDSDANSNRWSDLDRPPLNAVALRRALVRNGGHGDSGAMSRWCSTPAPPTPTSSPSPPRARRRRARSSSPRSRTPGAGRLDRQWTAPARSGPLLLRPAEARPRSPWSAGAGCRCSPGSRSATGLSRAAGVDTALKWPNDLLVTVDGEERKTGGILAERAGADAVVIGIGINVTLREDELPVPARGFARPGREPSTTDRDTLLRAVLRSLEQWYGKWRAAGGDPAASRPPGDIRGGMLHARAGRCGRSCPAGPSVTGEAVAVDGDGRLVLATAEGVQQPVGAGDIVHLRPAGDPGDAVTGRDDGARGCAGTFVPGGEQGARTSRTRGSGPPDIRVRSGPRAVRPRRSGVSHRTPAVELRPVDT